MQTALLAGAAFFVPHRGLPATHPPKRTVSHFDVRPRETAHVFVNTVYRLPPEFIYEEFIQEAADRFGVDAALIRAVIRTESAFDAYAVSPVGAQGLMQLMPALSEELGVMDPFDPRENIMAGTRYLADLLAYHSNNIPLALASYNAGPGTVQRYGGIPPYKETEKYVRTIVELLNDE
jgi:soluble lytic murein transglycosylase-like protein